MRYKLTIIAIIGIAGSVGVFVAVLAMAKGFQTALISSGSNQNAIILRGGATSEMESGIGIDQCRVIESLPGIMHDPNGSPLSTAEVVVVASIPIKKTGSDALVQLRGVSDSVLLIRDNVKMEKGRFFNKGTAELVAGKNAERIYKNVGLNDMPNFGGRKWRVVGVFDAGGSAFDSEIWCDANLLNQTYKRPDNVFQSITVKLKSVEAFKTFKDAATSDPRLTVQTEREIDYYAKQSRVVTNMIRILGFLVVFVMGLGAIFGALNTMYSIVASKIKEIAILRAIGFSRTSIIFSIVIESLFISLAGGILGCLFALPFNGYTTGTVNWQTFSHLAFAFRITPSLLGLGILFALIMGFIGGLPPAIRASRQQISNALREL